MGITLAAHSMSLDGFIAQTDDKAGPLHDWLFNGDTPSRHNDDFRLSESSRDVFDELLDDIGATIAGRRTYDAVDGWGGNPPFDLPFFIVTHRAPEDAANEASRFDFVTDGVESALEHARAAAGKKDVSMMGANIVQQCIRAGLLDEIQISLVPVLLGDGVRFFDDLGSQPIELERYEVVESPGVTHLRFRVVKR